MISSVRFKNERYQIKQLESCITMHIELQIQTFLKQSELGPTEWIEKNNPTASDFDKAVFVYNAIQAKHRRAAR